MVAFSAVSGGLSAQATGGDFWGGFITAATVAACNHAMHIVDGELADETMVEEKQPVGPPTETDWLSIAGYAADLGILAFDIATIPSGEAVPMIAGRKALWQGVSRFGQIRGGIQKTKSLAKSNHNLKLRNGNRIDIKGRHPNSKGHYNKVTDEQFNYPHVHDSNYPGGVRAPIANDYIEIFFNF